MGTWCGLRERGSGKILKVNLACFQMLALSSTLSMLSPPDTELKVSQGEGGEWATWMHMEIWNTTGYNYTSSFQEPQS